MDAGRRALNEGFGRAPFGVLSCACDARDPETPELEMLLRNAALLAVWLSSAAAPALAGDIALDRPWSRATPANAPVGAGYVTIRNSGAAADRLVSATADVAGKVEIHEMAMADGVMKMRQVQGIDISAGKSAELKPGGYHLMFMGLRQPLKAGETIKGALTFEKAGTVPVEFKVESMAGQGGHGH